MFGSWTHVVGGDGQLFFYDADTGAAAFGTSLPTARSRYGVVRQALLAAAGRTSSSTGGTCSSTTATRASQPSGRSARAGSRSTTATPPSRPGGPRTSSTCRATSCSTTSTPVLGGGGHPGRSVRRGGGPFPFLIRIDYRDVPGMVGSRRAGPRSSTRATASCSTTGATGQYVVAVLRRGGQLTPTGCRTAPVWAVGRNSAALAVQPCSSRAGRNRGGERPAAILRPHHGRGYDRVPCSPAERSHWMAGGAAAGPGQRVPEGSFGRWTHIVEAPEVRPSAP